MIPISPFFSVPFIALVVYVLVFDPKAKTDPRRHAIRVTLISPLAVIHAVMSWILLWNWTAFGTSWASVILVQTMVMSALALYGLAGIPILWKQLRERTKLVLLQGGLN